MSLSPSFSPPLIAIHFWRPLSSTKPACLQLDLLRGRAKRGCRSFTFPPYRVRQALHSPSAPLPLCSRRKSPSCAPLPASHQGCPYLFVWVSRCCPVRIVEGLVDTNFTHPADLAASHPSPLLLGSFSALQSSSSQLTKPHDSYDTLPFTALCSRCLSFDHPA